ncbi:DUF2861 family protein [Vibrio cortegadensis]|uniref:DUF2861 family protein n=1 Tax=Vibrio cortegadensis TaxID=1328770 RepID=UPI00352E600F
MRIKLLGCFFFGLTLPLSSQAAWFSDTPLQHTYQAMIDGQPKLAWEELKIAVSQHSLSSQYWLPVKNEIIAQTECGKGLDDTRLLISNLKISFIRRFGLASQGYQINISTEKSHGEQDVSLLSPTGQTLISGHFSDLTEYQEFETKEILVTPSSGVYILKVDQDTYPIVASLGRNIRWLKVENALGKQTLSVSSPENITGCPRTNVNWQWFDGQYNMLGNKIPIGSNNAELPTISPFPSQAHHLSAAVELTEYQGRLQISYIQRVALPFKSNLAKPTSN